MTATQRTVLTDAKIAYYERRAREARLAAWGSLFRRLSGRVRHDGLSTAAAKTA